MIDACASFVRQGAVRWSASVRRLAAGVAIGLLAGALPARPAAAPATARLSVRLVSVATLPLDARAALVAEVERLWQRAGLDIEWVDASAGVGAEVALRVLVLSRHSGSAGHGDTWPVGEFMQHARPVPTAVTSLAAAVRVIEAARLPQEPTATVHQRLGRILGRAVAHEIGHHLLGSTHGRRGLMRARIDAADFADLRDGHFEVDRADAVKAIAAATDVPVRLALARAVR